MGLGFGEIAILAVLLLLFFGAGKIPKLMGDMASGIKEFKKGMRDEMAEQSEKTAAKNAADPAPTAVATAAQTQAQASNAPPVVDVKAEIVPPPPPRV
jgi:sec-independent protein translocase protein TatA